MKNSLLGQRCISSMTYFMLKNHIINNEYVYDEVSNFLEALNEEYEEANEEALSVFQEELEYELTQGSYFNNPNFLQEIKDILNSYGYDVTYFIMDIILRTYNAFKEEE